MDEAKITLAEARRLNPKLTVKWLQSAAPNIPALFDGLRKAGLPEERRVERGRFAQIGGISDPSGPLLGNGAFDGSLATAMKASQTNTS